MPFALPAYYGASGAVAPSGLTTAIRFPGAITDYLSLVFGAGGNAGLYTASWWLKQLTVGANRTAFAADGVSGILFDYEWFNTSNQHRYNYRDGTDTFIGQTLTDTANWYHYVMQLNGTAFTSWINNTADASGTLTGASIFNSAVKHSLGARARAGVIGNPFHCLMADFILVDGQALTPSSFGYDNAGTWSWLDYAGSFTGNTDARLLFGNAGNLGEATQGSNWTVTGSPTQETGDLPPQ